MIYFDSKANHLKIFLAGSGNIVSSGSPGTRKLTIYHNLGYYPNVRVFCDPQANGNLWPFALNSVTDQEKVKVFTNRIEISMDNNFSRTNTPIHYRIYEDGQIASNKYFDSKKRTERIFYEGESGSVYMHSTPPESIQTIAIPHGQGETMMPVGRWSIDGGTTWHMNGTSRSEYNPASHQLEPVQCTIHADATNIYYEFKNYGPNNYTMRAECLLMKLTDDGITFDSKKKTLLNTDTGTGSVLVNGSIGAGTIRDYTIEIPHTENDSLSDIYLSRSDASGWQLALPGVGQGRGDMEVSVGGGGKLGIIATVKTESNKTKVVLSVFNGSSVTQAIVSADTWTARQVLYKVS